MNFKIFAFILFFCISTFCTTAQEASLVIPKGSKYSILGNDDNVNRTIFIHPQGEIWISNGYILQSSNKSIELPPRIKPNSFCWTNSGKLTFFYDDTLYALNNKQILESLAIVETKNIIIQPFGKTDIVFCALGDTVIYQYEIATNLLKTLFSNSKPIIDFVVDDEDVYFATENKVVAFLKEKLYVPIFQNTNRIYCIGFCGSKAMFFSDKDGLWIVDMDRNKSTICNQPVVDIVTDGRDMGFFRVSDGSWLFVSQISNYLKQTQ